MLSHCTRWKNFAVCWNALMVFSVNWLQNTENWNRITPNTKPRPRKSTWNWTNVKKLKILNQKMSKNRFTGMNTSVSYLNLVRYETFWFLFQSYWHHSCLTSAQKLYILYLEELANKLKVCWWSMILSCKIYWFSGYNKTN